MSLIPFSFWKAKVAAPQGPAIVTDQLISHLDAGNPSSYPGTGQTWFDLTGNANADITGNMVTRWNAGGWFDCNNDITHYADLTLAGVNSSTPVLTIEMWTRLTDLGPSAGMLFGFSTYDFFHLQGSMGFNTSSGDVFGMGSNIRANEDGWFDQWQHIVCVMYQTSSYVNNKIYLNGIAFSDIQQMLGSENAGNRSFNNGAMRINGWRNDFNYRYDQDIAVFRVYKKELSEEEVQQNYNASRVRFGKPALKNFISSGCKLYFDFEGESLWHTGFSTRAKDFSGGKQYGTLFNGASWNFDGGGNFQFRNTHYRYFDINRPASQFGIFYGSATFVFVFRYTASGELSYLFHPSNARAYGSDVNIRVQNNNLYYSHNTGTDPVATGLSANTWYHVAMSYNYNTYTVQIFLNGSLVVSNGFQERMIDNNDNYYLGRDTGTWYNYDLGLFMIYNRVLSGSEVTQLFSVQRTRFGI